jgi:hypothetical protein
VAVQLGFRIGMHLDPESLDGESFIDVVLMPMNADLQTHGSVTGPSLTFQDGLESCPGALAFPVIQSK